MPSLGLTIKGRKTLRFRMGNPSKLNVVFYDIYIPFFFFFFFGKQWTKVQQIQSHSLFMR